MIETEETVSTPVGNVLHITCSKDELVQALGVVSRAVSTRTSVQILSGILLEAEGSELRLAATDMELSLRTALEAEVSGEGEIVVPGRLLLDVIRGLPDAEAVIQRLTRFTRPINYLGLPSLAIPAGFTRGGLPVGLQLVGRSFDEATLLRIGAAFQRATDFHDRVPAFT
jgi:hypothetical protein